MEKDSVEGVYQDEKGELWVAIHLDGEEDLLEWGEDISYRYGLPKYSLITSGNCDFLNIEHIKEMNAISTEKYDCIRFEYNCYDYAYANSKVIEESILIALTFVKNYNDLVDFLVEYEDLIHALGKDNI